MQVATVQRTPESPSRPDRDDAALAAAGDRAAFEGLYRAHVNRVFSVCARMVGDRLKAALAKNGLVELRPAGEHFDPHAHESVAHVPHATIAEDHVVDVYRAGYKLHDRVIRPATVTVSSGPAA